MITYPPLHARLVMGLTLVILLAIAVTPAAAQSCLGFAPAGPVPALEVGSAFARDGIGGPTTVGANFTWRNVFAIVETGADPSTGLNALAVNGVGATVGASMQGPLKLSLCAAATRSSEKTAGGSLRATAGHLAAGWPIPLISRLLPLTAYSSFSYERRSLEFGPGVHVLDGIRTGLSVRTGISYYPVRFVGVRLYEDYDVASESRRFGLGLSLRFPLAPRDSDGDGVLDAADRCPNTPLGTPVTAEGCPRDSDGDGVIDALDRCLDTPAGTPVTAEGCPRDSDGDGVIDALDRCPNTPTGTPVTAEGCPQDSDGDGVIDALDRCPNTPAGTPVTAEGCPQDSDADGVIDALDRCPDTPALTPVTAEGCRAVFAQGSSFTLRQVTFESARATIRPSSFPELDDLAAGLAGDPTVRVEIAGHTDATGLPATNERLSLARAEAVRQYLIEKGIAGDRLVARGYGQSRPVATNATPAGRAANRRVEVSRLSP